MEEHKIDLKILLRLFSYLKPSKWLIAAALIFIILARTIDAIIPLGVGYLAKNILSSQPEALKNILFQGFYLIGILFLGYFFDFLATLLKSSVGSSGLLKLRMEIFKKIENLPLIDFDKDSVGRLMTRVMNDVDQINQMFSESLIPIIGNVFLFILIISGMIYLDYKIALIIICIFPILLKLTNRFRIIQRKCFDKIRVQIALMNGFVQEHLAGVMTIRHFHIEAREQIKFDKINHDLSNGYLESTENFSFYISANDFLQSSALIIAFLVLSLTIHPFQAALFFIYTLYVMMIFRPLMDLAERYNVLQSAFAAADRIFEILDRKIEPEEGLDLQEIETIEFKEVWFQYHPGEWVLKGLNIKLEKGKSYAIVGQTGAGKTSIISLLLRFYDIQKGEILINGLQIEYYKRSQIRNAFGLVLQDPILFSGTVADNVSLFNTHISEKEIIKALAYVGLNPEWIDKKVLERGKSLSSGQIQLIQLARVHCLKRGFLLLDEATASIDPITESTLQIALQKLLNDSGGLVIAHRLSTIKDVSLIYVLVEGSIEEQGTHDALIQQKKVYEKLYQLSR